MIVPNTDDVLRVLRQVKGPDMQGNIVDLGLVSDIYIKDGKVFFSISVPAEKAAELEGLRQAAEKITGEMHGVTKASVALTAEVSGNSKKKPAPVPSPRPRSAPNNKPGVPGVKKIIAVASGKGGVGKSTTAVNLALALQALGNRVGILDADIYGPSLPRLLGISGRPKTKEGKILRPMEGYGLKVMSMGFMVEEDTAMIWRGPMVISALTQMLREVDWQEDGELDVLVVDMPPGTGDAQLTMAQQVPLAGAVIVSTPQDLALLDARKGISMFNKVNVPLIGIVENMSYFLCPSCGERSEIFGHGGARMEAEKLNTPFLGAVPLHMEIRQSSDEGRPIVVSNPDSEHSRVYKEIAEKVHNTIQRAESAPAPVIVID
ncbi:MAG: iron-sulfur cluster carrier protein ApbC [Cohaesibacteraceae bacterium]|nr:iron-sulfur cluster carrier protein ApbC [Cohaesibacteraceae bacterium]MBL4877198.1 iron-sulfur cluster carrier protein ApbC [Cohaesibacteraceae bacterium]